jgi:2-isopropylmalate synthase
VSNQQWFRKEVFVSPRRIQIFDTTLRDGGASPGVALRPDDRAAIAAELERLRVDVVEAGSAGDPAGVRAVVAAVSAPTVAVAAQARQEDLEAAGAALAGARRSRIHVCVATSEEESVRWAVETALGLADEVQLSVEDATAADLARVAHVCGVAVEAGATVVGLPDAGGRCLPAQYAAFLAEVRRRSPGLERVTLSVHCHDDLGLAVAGSLAAVEAGAGQVECTVNGIGERAGNTSLEELVVALHVRADHFDVATGIDTTRIATVSRLVAQRSGYVVQPNKAIVGANAFAHEAGIHQDGMLKDERTYQIVDPSVVGVRMTLPLGKHSGRHAFAMACAERGIHVSGEELNTAFRKFKALADFGGAVPIDAVFEEVTA